MAEFEINDASTMPSHDPSSSLLLTVARPLISRLHREAVDRSPLCMLLTFCSAMLCFACLPVLFLYYFGTQGLPDRPSFLGRPLAPPSVCLRLDGDGSFRRIWSSGSGRSPFVCPPARLSHRRCHSIFGRFEKRSSAATGAGCRGGHISILDKKYYCFTSKKVIFQVYLQVHCTTCLFSEQSIYLP